METVTVSEFNKEMDRIKNMQDEVEKILNSNWFSKWWNFGKATRLHNESGKAMHDLWSKELVTDSE